MKKAVVASAALIALGMGVASAADLPISTAPPPVYVPQFFTWTGFYIGGNIGAAFAQIDWTDTLFGLDWGRTSDPRFMGGGQVGFNYQFTSAMVGVEADFGWVANSGNAGAVTGPLGHSFQVLSNDRGIATLAGRFGIAAGHALFYAKGGGGWVWNDGFTVTDLTTGATFGGSRNTEGGWLVGGGVEYAFTNHWTVKFEYDYLGLSPRSFTLPGNVIPALAGDTISSRHNIQMAKVGFNYLFNWWGGPGGPVVAKY
jgi:outer membrane immunogenic protein